MSQENNNHNNQKKVQSKVGNHCLQGEVNISGPLPSASEMKQYNDISPDLVNRIVTLAEAESNHRHKTENEMISRNSNLEDKYFVERKRGQILAGIIAFCALLCCFGLGFIGSNWAAGVVGSSTVIGLVTIFITGKYKN